MTKRKNTPFIVEHGDIEEQSKYVIFDVSNLTGERKITLPNESGTLITTSTSTGTVPALTITSVDINGGTIDNTTIGASTPSSIIGTTIRSTTPPTTYTSPTIGIGVYGTPVVDTAVTDNIAFTVNMSTATNKTSADSSCMGAFIGIANTTATTNNKIQGLLTSTTLHGNCYDAYAVQGHTTIHDAVATQNSNAHITGISGKTLLSAAVTQGWVTGGLFILDGTGAVTQKCSAISAVIETGVTAADSIIELYSDATVPTAIEITGAINMTDLLITADAGFASTRGTPSQTATCDGGLKVKVGNKTLYIPLYNTITIS
jgi:hypothetical protein